MVGSSGGWCGVGAGPSTEFALRVLVVESSRRLWYQAVPECSGGSSGGAGGEVWWWSPLVESGGRL